MKSHYLFLLTILLLPFGQLHAQQKCLHGKITNEKNEPLVGITILQVGTNNATASNQKGEFDLDYSNTASPKIQIQGIGYKTSQQPIEAADGHTRKTYKIQEDILGLDQVVVTATRSAMNRKEAPVIVQVTDHKALEAVQAVSLVDGLAFQPGLFVENNCQNCGFTGVRMNGLETAYTQIVIDGRPIFSSLNAVYGLEQIPTNMIERVEVVRGGGSALYGGNAIAGTINVITKNPIQNDVEVSSNQMVNDQGARDQSYSFGANVVSDSYKSGISMQGFHRERDHWDADGDGFSEIGQMNATALNMKAFYTPSAYSKVILNAGYTYENRRGGNKFELQPHETDITEMTTHHIKNVGITYEQFTKNRKHKFSAYASNQSTDRDSYYGAGMDENAYGTTKGNNFVSGLQYVGNLDHFLGGSAIFTSGTEFLQEDLRDQMPGYNRDINQTIQQVGWYNQIDWSIIEGLKFNAGLRFDHHSEVDPIILNPRFSLLYDIQKNFQMRLGYARGFRGPQVFDEDLHITAVGGDMQMIYNAEDLDAEYSDSYTVSWDYSKSVGNNQFSLTVDGFLTRHKNAFIIEAIGRDDQGNQIFERRNGAGATITGVSVAPKYAYSDKILMQAGATFQQSTFDEAVAWSEDESVAGEQSFLRTPNFYGFYTLSYMPTDRWTINLAGNYTGKMLVSHFAGYIEQDRLENVQDFFTQHIKLAYQFPVDESKMTLEAGVQNIFNQFQNDFDQGADRDAGYVYGPLRPRTYFIGLRFNI